jgi:hypothetical protein
MNIKEIIWEEVDRIDLAQNRSNIVMNLGFHEMS